MGCKQRLSAVTPTIGDGGPRCHSQYMQRSSNSSLNIAFELTTQMFSGMYTAYSCPESLTIAIWFICTLKHSSAPVLLETVVTTLLSLLRFTTPTYNAIYSDNCYVPGADLVWCRVCAHTHTWSYEHTPWTGDPETLNSFMYFIHH